jgi:hypothetical protein
MICEALGLAFKLSKVRARLANAVTLPSSAACTYKNANALAVNR